MGWVYSEQWVGCDSVLFPAQVLGPQRRAPSAQNAMALHSKKRMLSTRDDDIDEHHGDSMRVYMRHKRQRLYQQYHDSVYVRGVGSVVARMPHD